MAWRPAARWLRATAKHAVLSLRQRGAARVLAEAAGGRWGWRGRGAWGAYLGKRVLQELASAEWPFRRGVWSQRRREWRSTFALKLAQWADRAPGWSPQPYAAFRRNNALLPAEAAAQRAACAAWPDRPLVSVLTPVHNAAPDWLDRLAESVLAQTYDRWEWVLVDDASTNADTWWKLTELASRDRRIVVERLPANRGVCVATNRAAELSSGAFLAFADHDDELLPDALWEFADRLRRAPDADLLYSDEEIVPPAAPAYPMLKPAFSPELLLAYNYICHFVALRREVWETLGGLRAGTEGVQDYDLLLRALPRLRRVEHVARVLYRWHATPESLSRTRDAAGRTVAKGKLREATRRVVQEHLDRTGAHATAEMVGDWVRPRFAALPRVWGEGGNPSVSIIICSKDQPGLLAQCVRSLLRTAGAEDWELLLVDNDSHTDAARRMFARLAAEAGAGRCRVLRIANGPEGFNWSKLNNAAAAEARGEFLLFLNDDIEAQEPGWLAALVGMARQPAFPHPLGGTGGVGAVGALLEYPHGAIQHAGVIVGAMGWGPWHALIGATLRQPTDYQGWAAFPRNFRAVTGACLLTPRTTFERLGGFDAAELRVAFSDIDYCLRLAEHGLRIAFAPQARLVHHESQSRGSRLAGSELAAMARKARGVRDPYWHPALSRENHLLEQSSRRHARGLLFTERLPRIGFLGPAAGDGHAAPSWRGLARRLAAAGRCVPILCPTQGDAADALRQAELEHAPDAWFIQGSECRDAVLAATMPVVWQVSERLLARDHSPAESLRLAELARALRQPYQVVYGEPHTRAWAQAGWMGENQRFLDSLPEHEPLPRAEARAAWGIAAGEFVVAHEADAPPSVAEALGRLAFPAQRIVIGSEDDPRLVAAADVFVHHPCERLRDEPALQALAAGVPMLATRFAEHADLVQFGASAERLREHDAADLARQLTELHADPARRERMGIEARHWLASRADAAHVLREWGDLLTEAAELGAGKRPPPIPDGELYKIPADFYMIGNNDARSAG